MISRIVDFHSHILPGVDDGSTSLKESIEMMQLEAVQGILHVVATPHFYPRYDDPEHFLQRRSEAESALRECMQKYRNLPKLSIGAEVHYFPGISESDILSALTIDQGSCILIEMPSPPWSEKMYRELENIVSRRGMMPVIAHMDRYIRPLRTYKIPERLAELPVLVQANASFFLNKGTERMAMKLLKEDKIQLLGSDCHNMTTRKPNLEAAVSRIEKHLGSEALDRICYYQEEILPDV